MSGETKDRIPSDAKDFKVQKDVSEFVHDPVKAEALLAYEGKVMQDRIAAQRRKEEDFKVADIEIDKLTKGMNEQELGALQEKIGTEWAATFDLGPGGEGGAKYSSTPEDELSEKDLLDMNAKDAKRRALLEVASRKRGILEYKYNRIEHMLYRLHLSIRRKEKKLKIPSIRAHRYMRNVPMVSYLKKEK